MSSPQKHKEEAKKAGIEPKIGIIVVSTSRYELRQKGESFTDESGDLAESLIKNSGFSVLSRKLVSDEKNQIRLALLKQLFEEGCNTCITIGGTGVSKRDVTIEAVRALLDKEIPGFAELFRQKSFESVGVSAITTRSIAGVIEGRAVFCLPGSPDAVRVALPLILQELSHILYVAR
ncbi:hypothetical protein B9Q01_03070 [Candidatus Marsarchaeota G1 archaeon OSP_D]|uniref:MoaB/Mog domain-containing protein n=3 Tax=Candidatus Marsarchaeota group 1 TaxID=2203770 RepID=A0A2R6A7S8_9ARCH|nr:MAG: hypothetical protein B9Q02_11705 [Candidatus Marsarchaeota G1 archaeon BE_D]PSN83909.1 MAG: hypothetical protein B9Q01_03070 [Candidatus Marsarchaeota G1 archaeon OSP_D]PSN88652.1 MAG: hypothetical protein B9Q00_04710 [Candidatus Marsarchaeota G1 archaeon OSP_C]